MKYYRWHSFLAVTIAVSLAVMAGCAQVAAPDKQPAAPVAPNTQGVPKAPVPAPVSGASDLVVTRVWLDGLQVNYTVKNAGTADSPQTNSYLYVDDLMPAQGGTSFVDFLKPGQEKSNVFTNYQWPFGKSPVLAGLGQVQVSSKGFIELPLENHKVTVCADAKGEVVEAVETNNCKVTLVGIPWEYDLLNVSNLAIWRNGEGGAPEPGSERSSEGAHFQIPNADMERTPQLEVIPQQVPQGWMQGIWGFFYSDRDYGCPKVGAIKIPAKLHFLAKVGLARNATGSDGVTFRFGLRDLNDTVTWLAEKKATTPGALEDWDINLNSYEGQKCYFVLRVDSGASPVNDFAIWNQAKLIQVND